MRLRPAIILLILLFPSCIVINHDPVLINETFSSTEISSVQILMDKGEITLQGAPEDHIQIVGTTQSESSPVITLEEDILILNVDNSTKTDRVDINLPEGLNLEIQAFDVNIQMISLRVNSSIHNTAGDISIKDLSGETSLWAGRGDITVIGGKGSAIVIGEHGNLSVTQFSGPVSMTTIMGHIQFEGTENNQGDIVLEVDHGPVQAALPTNTDYQITIDSASGEIVCQGGNLERTISGCVGSTGDSSEVLRIRTVSGRIDFQITPEISQ